MRFEAEITRWDKDLGDEVDEVVVFEDVEKYILDENFLIVVTNDTHHAIKAHVVNKFVVTK